MKYLLDTHVFLWFFEDFSKLSETTINIIENTSVQKFVSIASLWEFAIKHSMGKIDFDGGLSKLWDMIIQNRFHIAPITQSCLENVANLPFIHKDPFDRLIIATAQVENMAIITKDANIAKYDVLTMW